MWLPERILRNQAWRKKRHKIESEPIERLTLYHLQGFQVGRFREEERWHDLDSVLVQEPARKSGVAKKTTN